jgi:hypothetical protein
MAKLFCVQHKCNKTPLSVFIEIANGHYAAVRRRLFPSKTTVEMACGLLQMEFATLCGDSADLFPQKKAIKLRVLVIHLQELFEIYAKSKKHRAMIEEKIFELTSTRSMDVARQQLQTWIIRLKEEEKRLEKETGKSKKGKKDDGTFEDLVIEVSKYNKFHIDRYKMTAAEFAGYVKSFKKDAERQARANGRKR